MIFHVTAPCVCGGVVCFVLPVMAKLLRRAQLSSWLSCRCSLDLVAEVAAGDRSGLLSFLKRRGGGAANSFCKEETRLIRLCVRSQFECSVWLLCTSCLTRWVSRISRRRSGDLIASYTSIWTENSRTCTRNKSMFNICCFTDI